MNRNTLILDPAPFKVREFVILWFFAAITFGAGDTLTTLFVVETTPSVVELNGLILAALDRFGHPGLVLLKLTGFGLFLAISLHGVRVQDRFLYYHPPIVLTIFGTFLTVYNTRLLIG